MGAGATAVKNAKMLQEHIARLGKALGLETKLNVSAGQTIWGTDRKVDVVFSQLVGGGMVARRLGVDCIFQEGGGTAKYKVTAKFEDVERWPVKGLVVYSGEGFGERVEAVMSYMGAVHVNDLQQYLRFYFDLPGIGGKDFE